MRRSLARVAGWRWWRSGTLRLACTLVLAAVIGVIVFTPDPGAGPGLAPWLEFAANIVMFLPVGAVAWWWRRSVPRNVAVGLAATVFIETVQGLFLPHRVADPRDVVANTAGALFGSLVCWQIARILTRPDRP
ncbi:MAG: VanZ family protein [Acidipropionibacterium acidipropionici]|nr:VanZ family protein [Acidipropionibacterium acidipropionici]